MSATAPPVVLGVDIGTTSTKVVAYTVDGRVAGAASAGYDLIEPSPGQAEQEPDQVVAAVTAAVAEVVSAVGAGRVAGLCFSAAMHSLLGLDRDGRPVTRLITWADNRATAQAQRLRGAAGALALHRRTGTPIHPMSPLTKLVWFAEQRPPAAERVAHWVGIKEYLLLRWCGALVIDHSVASGTGMLDLGTLAWDAEALRLAGLQPEQLPEPVPTTTVLPGLRASVAGELGLPAATRVVVGGSDGPLANLGLGAVRPGVAACSIGTSGALRVTVDRPAVDPLGRVFCYALTPGRWVVGGAINNGGVVLDWTGQALAPDVGEHPEELLRLAATVPAGSDGLLMLPYLFGERAPHWSSEQRGAYVGLTSRHGRPHLIRAAVEGVCQQLALVLQAMRDAGLEIDEMRATGGFARSPLWRQILSDTLGMTVGYPASVQGSSLGAALLGMQALGLVASIDVAADLVTITTQVTPDPVAAATYAALSPVFAQLYDALAPANGALHRLTAAVPAVPGTALG